eukprot:2436305-Amphidinium_carterae.1
MRFLEQIDKYFNPPRLTSTSILQEQLNASWLCVMDLASVHIASETRKKMSRLMWVSSEASKLSNESIDGDFDMKELNQRGFKRNAIGGWIASILTELAVQPKISLRRTCLPCKDVVPVKQESLVPETDSVGVEVVDDGKWQKTLTTTSAVSSHQSDRA